METCDIFQVSKETCNLYVMQYNYLIIDKYIFQIIFAMVELVLPGLLTIS